MELTEEFLTSALITLKQEILSSLHVAMPGIIQSYDSASGTAVIQPALWRRVPAGRIGSGNFDQPIISSGAVIPGTVSSEIKALDGNISSGGGLSANSGGKYRMVLAPLLRDVPVYMPDPGRTITAGEECLVIFADFCIDGWYDTGQPALPPSPRAHDLSDAFAFVGFRSRPRQTEFE